VKTSNQPPEGPTRHRVFAMVAALCVVATLLSTGLFREAASDDLCSNRVISQLPSPDGSSKIVTFTRDCGATTGFSVQAALLPIDSPLPTNPSSVFVADDNHGRAPIDSTGVPSVVIRWRDARSVFVQFPSPVRIFKADTSSSGVQIQYSPING